ncbi:MAG: GntR family transcriptional regulator [Paraclostridium sp.]
MTWEFDNNKPIYIQLIDILKLKIASQELEIGSKIKSVRDLSEEAGVNPNTMQRALAELERQELLYSIRTSGRYVTHDRDKIKAMKDEIATVEIKTLQVKLKKLGYTKNEMIEIITNNLREIK